MVKRGVLVGLGTDAMTTNMLEELRVALWAQHLRAREPLGRIRRGGLGALRQQPQIADRCFGLPLGELREGCVGDVVIIDYDPPTPLDSRQ